MPRNGSGVFSLPNSAFVSGTVIASAPMNSNFSDIASALTQSISLDGQTTLTGSIKFFNGTAAGPGVAFGGDATTGIYLSSAGTLGIAANGSSVGTWTTSGLAGATIVSPTISSPTVTNGTFSNPTATGTITAAAATFSGAVTTNGSLTVNGALTMASPVSVANGGTGDTSLTAYAVLCGGTTTTNPVQSVASLGSAGQILTSNGAGALPTFQAAPMNLLNTLTASNSATLSDTTSLTSIYKNYLLMFDNIIPVSSSQNLIAQLSTNGGSSYIATNYSGFVFNINSGGTTAAVTLATGILILNGPGTSAPGSNGMMYLYNPSAAVATQWTGQVFVASDISLLGGTSNTNTGPFNAIQFAMSSGNITSGTIKIYGIP